MGVKITPVLTEWFQLSNSSGGCTYLNRHLSPVCGHYHLSPVVTSGIAHEADVTTRLKSQNIASQGETELRIGVVAVGTIKK